MLRRPAGVPVLMYHALAARGGAAAGDKYCVSAESFRRHLGHIRGAGRSFALLAEHWGVNGRAPVGERVVLTFDDGRLSDYEVAYPLLLDAGASADFFVNTANVGTVGYLDWARMREMQDHGMSFQSHAHDHVVLLGLPQTQLLTQLERSRRVLEDHLGKLVEFLAVPYGLLDRRVYWTAIQAGYRAVCNSRHWLAQPGGSIVNRVVIHADTDDRHFDGLVSGRTSAYLPGFGRMALTHLPKRLLLKLRPGALGITVAESA